MMPQFIVVIVISFISILSLHFLVVITFYTLVLQDLALYTKMGEKKRNPRKRRSSSILKKNYKKGKFHFKYRLSVNQTSAPAMKGTPPTSGLSHTWVRTRMAKCFCSSWSWDADEDENENDDDANGSANNKKVVIVQRLMLLLLLLVVFCRCCWCREAVDCWQNVVVLYIEILFISCSYKSIVETATLHTGSSFLPTPPPLTL